VGDFDSYLIAYRNSFGEMDNVNYFSSWRANKSDIDWQNSKIQQMSGCQSLFGAKN